PTRSQSLRGLPLLLAMLWASSASAMPTTLVNNGPSSNRVDIVFLGDGYTHADHAAGLYDDHINAYVNYMFSQAFSDPFPRYHNFFNVHKITTNSIHSGADVPNATPPVFRVTPFNASYEVPAGETYNGSDNDRLILIDTSAADAARAAGLAGTNITADIQLMTVNSDKYGGSGGSWAVFSGPNFAASEVALHELAHSFAGLADEYGGFTTPYTGGEPSEPNVTTDPTGAKWAHWAGFDDPRG